MNTLNRSSRANAVSRLRSDTEFRKAHTAKALVSRKADGVTSHQIAVDGWLFWVNVYPDGTEKVIC